MLATPRSLLIEAQVATQTMAEGLDAMHHLLACFWEDAARIDYLPSETWRHLFTTALAEVVANGLRHAYAPRRLSARCGCGCASFQIASRRS